jgi:hypothetical protein
MKKLNFSSEPYKSAAATALIMTKNKETPSLFIIAKSFLNLFISQHLVDWWCTHSCPACKATLQDHSSGSSFLSSLPLFLHLDTNRLVLMMMMTFGEIFC